MNWPIVDERWCAFSLMRINLLNFILVFGIVAMQVSFANAQSRIDAELQNLRNLPPGYRSWCEGGDLIFKAPVSARFRIARAALCAGKPDGYVLCSSDAAEPRIAGREKIPLCSQIEAPGA